MAITTITLNGKAAQEIREMDIQFPVIVTVNIDANTARRNTTVWLVSEVGNMLIGGTPQLVVADRSLWRVPALLTSSKIGTVGQVGTVDVDAVTGKLLVNKELIETILNNAQELYRTTHPSNGEYIPECETSYPSHTFVNWMKDIAYQLAKKWSLLGTGDCSCCCLVGHR
jgi:hypothetical protein